MSDSTHLGGISSILSRQPRRGKSPKKAPELPFQPKPRLEIKLTPAADRVDPKRNTYILLIQPHGIRAAGGQYSADEAHELAKATRGWDWSLDENLRPKCLPQLEALLDRICKRSVSKKDTGDFSTKLKISTNLTDRGGEA